ncbi:F-box associated interaction domain [Arabidopsis suecica]|uniref:F-box associated interaction domain n=1 Tax=Arabidopsis suecica TaxID=45249 RepID=A0A8T1ZZ09_ARASU|nr:F-box associated interaction domain [Arabidopsis suecica]
MKLCIHQKKMLAKKQNRRWLKPRKTKLRLNPTRIYIPLDLQINTLLRLPVKSLLRFRCVSKLWSSIITSQDFKKQHLNMTSSSAPPRLLISFQDFHGKNLMLVSSPNPYVSSSSSSSCCVPYKDLGVFKINGKLVYNAVRGLICLSRLSVGICNPSTRQLHIFPQLKYKEDPKNCPRPNYFVGYDSIEDQYKVLAIDRLHWRMEHKILLLGREEAWREAPCVACPHVSHTSGMYMNGTLYYGASRTDIDPPNNNSIIVSFDVRLETFKIINVPSKLLPMGYKNMWLATTGVPTDKTLINYKGKIGVVEDPREGSFRMWVVEDAEKEEWSMNTFYLPESAVGLDFKVMNAFYTGEICLVRKELTDPFCLFYYNLDRKSMRSVTIEGLPISKLKRSHSSSESMAETRSTSHNKLIPMKYSWEEINTRREAGLCIFCDEQETPDHHLKHRRLRLVMVDLAYTSLGDVENLDSDLKAEVNEVAEIEVATESIETENRTIDREENADKILAISEEDLIPQFQVSASDSEILSNIKLREENSVLEDLVVMNENLEQEWDQNNINKRFEVEGDVERSQKVLSIAESCCAHQVFGKMSKHEEKLGIKKKVKGFKSWMFKYKAAKGKIKKQDNKGWFNTWSRKVSWKKNKFPKTWSMLNVDCLKDDDQVYHESLLIGLLIRFKFWKFKFMNRILQKIRPQIEEDRMDEDHKQQQRNSEPLATAPDFVIKFVNMNLQKKTGEHGYINHGKLMSDQERHDEILRSAPYANLGTRSFMEIDSLSYQSQRIQEQARNHSTDSILELSLLQPKDSFLKHQPQTVSQCLLVGRLYEQAHRKGLIIRKDGEDYEKGAQPLNVTSLFAGPSLMDHGGSSPYVKLETGSYLEPDSISELELESTESKRETNCVAQPQVSIFVMESSHQHKLLGNFDIHMVIEDQQAIVTVALSSLFNDSYLEVAEFCEQSTCVKSHKRKNRLTSKSWMFKYKRDNMKLHIPTMSKNVRMVVFRKMEAEEMIQPLAADGFQEGPLEMDMQDSEVAIIEVLRRVMILFQNSMVHHQPTVNEQDKEHHIMCLDKRGDWWSGIAQFRKPATSSFLYEEIIMVKEQLSHNSLVIQEVMRNKQIKFLKRWWFKYKSVEEGLKRMSSQLCKTYYFAVWHCWKRKTLPHISFFSLQYFQRIDTIMI